MAVRRRVVGLRHRFLTITAATLAGGLLSMLPPTMQFGEGFLYDAEIALLWRLLPAERLEPAAVVVALDAESLASPGLAGMPRALMAPFHAKLLDALLDAEAAVVGFDLIFAWSSRSIADATERVVLPDYDRSFVDALRRGRERIVLAHSDANTVVEPYYSAMHAFADHWALGYIEKFPDTDGVVRRVPLMLETIDGQWAPTLSGAVLARLGREPSRVPLLVRPRRHLEDTFAYAYNDIIRCAALNPLGLRALIGGKAVLVGTTLSDEDRLLTASRFLPPLWSRTGDQEATCPPKRLGPSAAASSTIAGVYLHAAAVDAAVAGTAAEAAPAWLRGLLGAMAGALSAFFGFRLRPWASLAAVAALLLAVFLAAALALAGAIWLPVVPVMAGAVACVVGAAVVRFLAEEARLARVRRAFGHYVSPQIVERLAEDEGALRLGGEPRDVSIMFADLSGFTALSGRISSAQLMALTNRYLALMTHAIEESGGYVDKYIGDAVMAIWGAPVADPRHAVNAALAALQAVSAVEGARTEDDARGAPGFSVKIGINSGRATVGNVGAPGRYNYTAVGETVNIAARLESASSDYGCPIVLGEETARAAATTFLLSELDWIQVKGKAEHIAVYELLCASAAIGPDTEAYVTGYAAALGCYRARSFAEAAEIWESLRHPAHTHGGAAPPNLVMANRARRFECVPPDESWSGVFVKESK